MIPEFLKQQLRIMPYHQFIELSLFLDNPRHVQIIEDYFGEILSQDVEMMGEEEAHR